MTSVKTLNQQNGLTNKSLKKSTDQLKNSRVLFLASSLLADRKLLYTNCLSELSRNFKVDVWATSARTAKYKSAWGKSPASVESFPEIHPFKEFPYNYLRRLNEFAWDYKLRPPSRLSMKTHVRNKLTTPSIKALELPARVIAMLGKERRLETWLDGLLPNYSRSAEAIQRLEADRPSVVISTGPHRFEEPAVIAAAKVLGIPTLAMIHSWDNLSTKNRMVFKYDGYLVWSEQMKKELFHFYPETRETPVYVVGAAQFDVFFQDRFFQTRSQFCNSQGLDEKKKIIVYALGSPNFLKEHYGALHIAKRVSNGEFRDVQLLVRPHPQFDNGEESDALRQCGPNVYVQKTGEFGIPVADRFQEESQIMEWVNTFRHADVVVNLSSTATVDGAILDRPIVNLDFDPSPMRSEQELIKDINHKWTHFKPIAESEGLWLVNDFDELAHAVKTYLKKPELHQAKRKWIAEYVCGFVDGKCGERIANAVNRFLNSDLRTSQK